MNLWTDSERKWALESESKPEIEENICFIMLCPIKILKTLFPLEVNNSSPVDKQFNFIKVKESLDWFGTQMGSRIRIKTLKLKKNIWVIRICPIKIHKTLFPLEVNNSSPVDKVLNFYKINQFLDWLWTEMGSRIRIKTRNRRKTSAS